MYHIPAHELHINWCDMCPGFQNFTTGPNHQSSEISAMMILLEKVEEGDPILRAGRVLIWQSPAPVSLKKVCLRCTVHTVNFTLLWNRDETAQWKVRTKHEQRSALHSSQLHFWTAAVKQWQKERKNWTKTQKHPDIELTRPHSSLMTIVTSGDNLLKKSCRASTSSKQKSDTTKT